ncbi:hypothetical protein Tco_0701472 [Tanacetum coccineum]
MRNAIEAEFAGSKHRLCMWHITQKLHAKFEYRWGKLMEEFKLENHKWLTKMFNIHSEGLVEDSEGCIIKESPYVYEMLKKKKKPQSVDKDKEKAEEDDTNDLFFKKDGLYKVLRNVGDGSVVCSCQLFNLIHAALRNKRNRYGKKNVVVENFANEATFIVDHCVHLLSKDEPRLGAFVEKLKSLKKDVEADCPNPPSKNKTNNLEQLVYSVAKGLLWVQKEVCQEEVVQEKVDLAEDEEELVEEDEDLIHE